MQTVNIAEKLSQFEGTWSPKILGEVNDSYVKAVKLKGEFVWHHHENEDELFIGDQRPAAHEIPGPRRTGAAGRIFDVPHGLEHLPVAEEETHVLLFEPKATLNTGNIANERTVAELERM